MEQQVYTDVYLIDLGDTDNAAEVIFRLSSVLDNEDVKNKNIRLKLGNVALNQAQLLSIKSLINAMGSDLSVIETISEDTEKTAISLGITIGKEIPEIIRNEVAACEENSENINVTNIENAVCETVENSCDSDNSVQFASCESEILESLMQLANEESMQNCEQNENNSQNEGETGTFEQPAEQSQDVMPNFSENETTVCTSNEENLQNCEQNENNSENEGETGTCEQPAEQSQDVMQNFSEGETTVCTSNEENSQNCEQNENNSQNEGETATCEQQCEQSSEQTGNEQQVELYTASVPPKEEIRDELDVIFGSNSINNIFEAIEPTKEEYLDREELGELVIPEKEYTKEDMELETYSTKYIKQTIRSGQVINYEGNVVIIGDCHPGSEIIAHGDITVWGVLGGIAHAGAGGNQKAKVRALKMNAIQLRIANCYSRRPDTLNTVYSEKTNSFTPEEARIINGEIVVFKIND